ncbi:hypothetical protein L593_10460 [Salinarchaeum sp. Harcht-Bsk1]|uniref:DUF7285 family protein n=1 Tax=Salinarchaeum sp. Harcht-Bsk1 TaxID=1333523 RepID=UPI0003423147|nr:hypothetical protein [Salinarchaeum sp. Harcht-Bsk1]AGN02037.1 hypothetical protein L593_10460 [Salinarchaeum sp. Harcht-Bsk1]
MSCSSRREDSVHAGESGIVRSWVAGSVIADQRGQTEPIAALVALLAIAIGLGLYAGVAADQSPSRDGTNAEATMQRVEAAILEDGVFSDHGDRSVLPERFGRPGETVRIEITDADGFVWTLGPRAPPGAASASRPITLDWGRNRIPAQLTVWVWES